MTQYIRNINGNPDCFLSHTEPHPNPLNSDKVDHHMTCTLLPHQIILFPKTILPNLDESVLTKLKYYGDDELR
jgi:hypothetical protein